MDDVSGTVFHGLLTDKRRELFAAEISTATEELVAGAPEYVFQ